jgi:peptidyl-prolyl cis-trans isomerase SurA
MKQVLPLVLVALALTAIGSSVIAQRETVDRIIAVVGDEIILASELASQIQFTVFQGGDEPKSEAAMMELRNNIMEQMVSDRLFLIAARKDTSIAVRSEEIDAALDERIAGVVANFPTHSDFLAALEAEGLILRDLRRRFRSEVENQMLKQRFIQRKLYSVSVSRHEVEQFFELYKDSIPPQPEGVKLAHVLLAIEPSSAVEDSVREFAIELRQRILDGADFATISAQYSSLGAGANGGDLGYVSRDDVVEDFARAAFGLEKGGISGVVRTQFGFHVIMCEDKQEDRAWLRHVLLAVQPTTEDTLRVRHLADSLIQAARDGSRFEELAKAFSVDNETRAQGGELGWFAIAQMPIEFADAVQGWQTAGEIRGPVISQFGMHILKLLEYQQEMEYTLADDFDRIKELARQDKTGQLVDEWITKLKSTTFIEYRWDG